jgi:hypothetical protein
MPVAHFGLGEATTVDVRVTLPSGKTVERPKVRAKQVLVVDE